MAEESTEEVEESEEQEVETVDEAPAIDLDESEGETEDKELEEIVEEQRETIEKLQGQLNDLSARVAHDGGIGVCPECNGPLVQTTRLFRRDKIECKRCGEVLHNYEDN